MVLLLFFLFTGLFSGNYFIDPCQHTLSASGSLDCTKHFVPIKVYYGVNQFMPHTHLLITQDLCNVEFFSHQGSQYLFKRRKKEHGFTLDEQILRAHTNLGTNFMASTHPSNYEVYSQAIDEVIVVTPNKNRLFYTLHRLKEDAYFSSSKKYLLLLKRENLENGFYLEYEYEDENLRKITLKSSFDESLIDEVNIFKEGRVYKVFAYNSLLYEIQLLYRGYKIRKKNEFFESFDAGDDAKIGVFQNSAADWIGFETFDDRVVKVLNKDENLNIFTRRDLQYKIYENVNCQILAEGLVEITEHYRNRVIAVHKLTTEDFSRLKEELEKKFDGIIKGASKEQFLNLVKKRSLESTAYEYLGTKPLISNILTFVNYNLVSAEQFFYKDYNVIVHKTYIDDQKDPNTKLNWEQDYFFTTNAPPCFFVEYFWDNKNINLLKVRHNQRLEQLFFYGPFDRIEKKLIRVDGQQIRAEEFVYDDRGFVQSVSDKDLTSNIQRIVEFSYNSFGAVTQKTYKTPSFLLKTEKFDYDDAQKLVQKKIFNAKDNLINQVCFNYDDKDRVTHQDNSFGEKFENSYNQQGWLVSQQIHHLNSFAEYEYDQRGLLIQTKTPRGIDTVTYDKFKRANSLTDFRGGTTNKTYNMFSSVTKVELPKVQGIVPKIQYLYDRLGFLKEEIDPMLRSIKYKKNIQGKNIVVEIASLKKYFDYTPQGLLTSEKKGVDDPEADYVLDPLGRAVEVHTKQGINFYEYNGFDVIKEILNDGRTTTYSYDDWGRLTLEVHQKGPLEEIKKIEYDENGFESKITFINKQHIIEKKHDLQGRLVEEKIYSYDDRVHQHQKLYYNKHNLVEKSIELIDGVFAETVFEYDDFGRCIEQIDPLGNRTVFLYEDFYENSFNEKVLKVTKILADKTYQIQIHDTHNQVVSLERFDRFQNLLRGEYFIRDLLGRILVQKTIYQSKGDYRQESLHYVYDSQGLLIERYFSTGSTKSRVEQFSYDESNNIVEVKKGENLSIFYEYDLLGRIARLFSSDATVDYTYEYDSSGRLVEVKNGIHQRCTKVFYNELGMIEGELFENGLSIKVSYNDLGDLKELKLPDSSSIRFCKGPFGVESIQRKKKDGTEYDFLFKKTDGGDKIKKILLPAFLKSIDFDYNEVGQLVTKKDLFSIDRALKFDTKRCITKRSTQDLFGEQQYEYGYDDLQQLTKATLASNRIYSAAGDIDFIGDRAVVFDKRHQMKNFDKEFFTFDVSGNRTEKFDEKKHFEYTYDALDRLIKVSTKEWTVEYIYDFRNRLIEQITTSSENKESLSFLYLEDTEIGSCKNNSEDLHELRILQNFFTKHNPSVIYAEIDQKSFAVFTDLYSNVKSVYDLQNCCWFQGYRYTPFGEITDILRDQKSFPWLYAGHRYDPLTELYFFERRAYDPKTGQFTSMDSQKGANVFNPYQYCRNNPFIYTDADGNFPIETSFSVDIAPWLSQVMNRWIEGKEVFRGGFWGSFEAGVSLPLDEFTKLMSDSSSYLSRVLRQVLSKDQTSLERRITRHFESLQTKQELSERPSDNPIKILEILTNPRIIKVIPSSEDYKEDNLMDIFTNGMCNTLSDATEAASSIANFLNKPVYLVWNPKKTFYKDLKRVSYNKTFRRVGESAQLLKEFVNQVLDQPDQDVRIWCHSEGALNVSLAFQFFPDSKREKMEIYTFGAAELIPNTYAKKTMNFVSEKDLVPVVSDFHLLMGRTDSLIPYFMMYMTQDSNPLRDEYEKVDVSKDYNILVLPSNKRFDHLFLGETYQNAVKMVPSL